MAASLSTGKKLLFWFLLLAGTLGVIETIASVVYFSRHAEEERDLIELTLSINWSDNNSVLRYVSHPYFNYVSNPDFRFANGYVPHNAMGLRGPVCCPREKQPATVRIVAIGGSTTYGMYFSDERNVWPALMERSLQKQFGPGIEVINAGVPNYTTYELISLTAMRIPEFAPDILLIHTGLNDAFTVAYVDEGGPDNTGFRHAWAYQPMPDWLKQGMRASYAVRLAALAWSTPGNFQPYDMSAAIQYSAPSDAQVIANAQKATGKYFRRNLQTLVALSKNMGATPVLINEPLNPAKETGQNIFISAVGKAVVRNNQISKEIAERNGLVLVDLYGSMRDAASFLDAAHENQAGMQIKASQIAIKLTPLIKQLVQQKTLQASKQPR